MGAAASPAPSPALSKRSIAGYGIGDFGLNLYWSGTSFFLLYWYTDVANLPNQVAGLLFFAGSVWDALTDPAMGVVAERTRTRWGRYRPWLLLGSVPLAASFALLLWVPPLTGMALVGFLLFAHLLFRTCYTVVSVPYSALSARLTHDSQERIFLSSGRMLAASSGALTIAASAFPLVHWLGQGDEQTGFVYLGMVAGVAAIALHLLCFASTSEPDMAEQSAAPEPPLRLADVVRMVRLNQPFVLVFVAVLLLSGAATLIQKNFLYFVKYVLQAHDQQHLVLLANGLLTLLLIPVWTLVARRFGKRNTWLLATAIVLPGLLALYLFPVASLQAFIVHTMLITCGSSAFGMLFWSMLPDTVEYGEWKTGVRSEAIVFGFTTFAQKVSLGFAGWVLGVLLDVIGYRAGVEQTPETLQGIRFIMTILPLILMALATLLIARYPLTESLHRRIRDEIAQRKA